jgi:hypothetical protein
MRHLRALVLTLVGACLLSALTLAAADNVFTVPEIIDKDLTIYATSINNLDKQSFVKVGLQYMLLRLKPA